MGQQNCYPAAPCFTLDHPHSTYVAKNPDLSMGQQGGALAGLFPGIFHLLLPFGLAFMYWVLKNAVTYYLPRTILFVTSG